MSFTKIVISAIFLSGLIVGCGGSDDNSSPVPTPGTAPEPTATPTATPDPISPITYGPELIINGGFESDNAGDTPSSNWAINDNGGTASAEVIESTSAENTHSGTKALEVSVMSLGEQTYSIEVTYDAFDVEGGEQYEYSFWVKGTDGTRVDFTIGDPSFAELGRNSYTIDGNDWQQIILQLSVPESISQLRLPTHFSIAGNEGATFYLDDLSFRTYSVDITYSDVNVDSLAALAPDGMPIGVAVPAGSAANSILANNNTGSIVSTHFNQVTAENIMKMDAMQPSQGNFSFTNADALHDFASLNNMSLHGHALVWHSQAPQWMRDFDGEREDWINMMETHVTNVAGHFEALGDTLVSWDVVNEAWNDQGTIRGSAAGDTGSSDSIWYDNIGQEFIELAFTAARAADPDADLYYNDYNMLYGDAKFDSVVGMINDFQERGIPIDGLGMQGHIALNSPSLATIRDTLERAVSITPPIKIKITELDIRVNAEDPAASLFLPEAAEAQKEFIHDIVATYLEVVPPAQRGGITMWGVHDGDTWLVDFWGRIEWPLLFLEDLTPKPALQGFADALDEGN